MAERIVTRSAESGNPAQINLVFTTAVFGFVPGRRINQLKYMRLAKHRKIGLSTGESAKTG
jgi:hypothetical protein